MRYASEMRRLQETLKWVRESKHEDLATAVERMEAGPLLAVGSGGSMVAAEFAAALHRSRGRFAEAVTPLGLEDRGALLPNNSVLLVSSSGRNADILRAARVAIDADVRELVVLTANGSNRLVELARDYWRSSVVVLDLSIPKDGFLATNSLLAFSASLCVGYGSEIPEGSVGQLPKVPAALFDKDTLVVLYAGWGRLAALDIESKCSEAGLTNVLMADLRNFGHGRHVWLDKRGGSTGVLAAVDHEWVDLANDTLSLIPQAVPKAILSSPTAGPAGGVELLQQAMQLVEQIGSAKGIDPGRPGVPNWGRQLYHLTVPFTDSDWKRRCIVRKAGLPLSPEEEDRWGGRLDEFLVRLESATYGAILLDYDGTICSREGRFTGMEDRVAQELGRLVGDGVRLGVATGRGRSVRDDLRRIIPETQWSQVLVGYYNGGQVGSLDDESFPMRTGRVGSRLRRLAVTLSEDKCVMDSATVELRPHQITIQCKRWDRAEPLREQLRTMVAGQGEHFRMVESSHSWDIIPHSVRKTAVLQGLSMGLRKGEDVLCIGDRGSWPGNDYELLATPFSLSVDEVSRDPDTCWNLALPGEGGTGALWKYLRSLVPGRRSGSVHLRVGLNS